MTSRGRGAALLTRGRERYAALPRGARDGVVLALTALVVMGVLAQTSAQNGTIQWGYLAGLLLTISIYSVFALGLSLEFGYTGLLNFGHVAFMAIGAYSYGILMMRPGDRPSDAPGIVGSFYDMAPSLSGPGIAGFLVSLLLALIVGALVAIPILALLGRVRSRIKDRTRLWAGIALGLVVALVTLLALYPLADRGAMWSAAAMSMLVGVVLAAFTGLLLGLPTLRLREDYLAIVTIGAAEILRSVILNEEAWTRGTRNILNFPRPAVEWGISTPWWRDFARSVEILPATLALLVLSVLTVIVVFIILQVLARAPWGRVLRAIREDEEAAAAIGKNPLWYKLQSLMLGSAIAAVAGILFVTSRGSITPTHFLPIITFYAFIIVVIGGMGNHVGAIVGSFILWGVFALSQNLPALAVIGLTAGPPQGIFIGALLIVIMMFRPQGLVGSKEELAHAK